MKFVFDAIGTKWQVDIYDQISKNDSVLLLEKINNRIKKYDVVYSRFQDDSLVTKMSLKKGMYKLPDDAKNLIEIYENIYNLTSGAVTPLIGQLLVDSGYDSKYSLFQKRKLNPPPMWNDAIDYSFPNITLKVPVLLDFGAAGKGYLIDIVSKILEKNNITSYCIDAGGDIKFANKNNGTLRVGLENPNNISQVIGVVEIKNKSICGSAGNRRKWGNYHHIFNPMTMEPVKDIIATWVISDLALTADAVATALFFVQPKILSNDYNFEYLVLNADRTINISPKFPGEIFSK